MLQLKRILFPSDFSRCADQAFTHALYLAEQYKAELHMLHAIVLHEDDPHNPAHHFPDVKEIYGKLKEIANARMKLVIDDLTVRELKIKHAQVRGIASAPVILDYADENKIDFIVMGTHGRRGVGLVLLGSVAEEIIRLSACPVLTIREQKKPKSIEAIEQILVPVDFSGHSRKALSYAKEIAAAYDARLRLLHVVEKPLSPFFYAAEAPALFELSPKVEKKSSQALENLFREAGGPEVSADFVVMEGRAARDIIRDAKESEADLIVIATHGLTGIELFFMGSVTEKVVRRSPCPVLTVKVYGKNLIEQ